jgi:branched-chain amino acid transport system permease protein
MAVPNRVNPWIGLILALAVFLAIPLIASPFHIMLLTQVIIFALFAVSYNLLLGYSKLLSFGHAMFFGLGAYSVAVFLIRFPGLSFFGGVLVAVAITTVAGFLIGCLLLRHKGASFALLTLAFNALFFAIATKWYSVSGGDDGLSIRRPDIHLGGLTLNLSNRVILYYVILLICGTVIAFCWYFTRTAMGRTVLLMRENEERMRFVGYSTAISRLILFTFTAALAGLAGALYTFFFGFVALDAISINMTATVLLMTFIGGTDYFLGPIVGAAFYIYIKDYLSDVTEHWPFFMGLFFILLVLFAPAGLTGGAKKIAEYFRSRRRQPSQA